MPNFVELKTVVRLKDLSIENVGPHGFCEWEVFSSLAPANDSCLLYPASQLLLALLVANGRATLFDCAVDPADGVFSLRTRFFRPN